MTACALNHSWLFPAVSGEDSLRQTRTVCPFHPRPASHFGRWDAGRSARVVEIQRYRLTGLRIEDRSIAQHVVKLDGFAHETVALPTSFDLQLQHDLAGVLLGHTEPTPIVAMAVHHDPTITVQAVRTDRPTVPAAAPGRTREEHDRQCDGSTSRRHGHTLPVKGAGCSALSSDPVRQLCPLRNRLMCSSAETSTYGAR
jgi:hypothetical protein